jgi:hypothetical protein
MSGRIIELRWNCSECSSTNIKGREKRCPNCGSPREKGEMDMDGLGAGSYGRGGYNKAATVTDAKLLDLATAGADWFCTHCDAGNRGDRDRCEGLRGNGCGAPRYGKAEEDHPVLGGGHRDVTIGDDPWEDGYEPPDYNPEYIPPTPPTPATRQTLPAPRRRSVVRDYDPDPVDDYMATARKQREQRTLLLAGSAAVAVTLLVGFLVWAFTTHEVEGSVTAMTWEQSTHRENWTTFTSRKWRDETRQRREVEPINGSGEQVGMTLLGGCREEHHHDEQYVCGSHEECTPRTRSESYDCGETCRDNGNGFATCTTNTCYREVPDGEDCRQVDEYCDRAIYETRCNYETQEWRRVQTETDRGTGRDTTWPSIDPDRLDRLRYSADYTVRIDYHDRGKDKTYAHKPGNTKGWLGKKVMQAGTAKKAEAAYLSWETGEHVTLEVRNIGSVARVHRGGQAIEVAAE